MCRFSRWVIALTVVAGAALPASAEPIVTAGSATVLSPNTTGQFNVSITVPVGDPSIQLGGFDIIVNTSGGGQFTAADFPASNYVFAGASFDQDFSSPLSFSTFPGTSAEISDLSDASNSYVTINAGQTFTLGTISFSAATGGSTFPLTVVTSDYPLVFLTDGDGNPIPFTTANGTITVNAPESASISTPEPASITIFGAMAAGGAVYGWRRRKVAAVA